MSSTLDSIDFLAQPGKHAAAPVCALFGDEPFLKRLVLAELRQQVLADGDAEISLVRFDGRSAEWRNVSDELSTLALFGGRRMVVVDDADDFVTRYRPALEDYAARPRTSAVLVLEVSTWPKTTRLYKSLDKTGLQIECKCPSGAALSKWLVAWAKTRHKAKLAPAAAEELVELVGPELGLLDQELAKLAVSVGEGEPISPEMVHELVGGWRAKTAWDMLDAALAGNAREALSQLDRLMLAGEHPVGVLAQMSVSLRRFAAATRLIERGEASGRRIGVRPALEQAGVKPIPFVMNKSEQQIRQLGRQRAGQMYRWLLDADLDMKGNSALPPRVILERLIVRMSSALAPRSG